MNDITVVEPDVEIQINPDATFDDWKDMGRLLSRATEGMCWSWGKWWELGHKKYNSKAVDFVDNELPLARGTIAQYAIVWRTFPSLQTRVCNLSFKHHRHVVAMRSDEKKMRQWLQKAIDNKWSADELRCAIHGKEGGTRPRKKITATSKRLFPIKEKIAEIIKMMDVPMLTLIPQTHVIAELRNIQKQLEVFTD